RPGGRVRLVLPRPARCGREGTPRARRSGRPLPDGARGTPQNHEPRSHLSRSPGTYARSDGNVSGHSPRTAIAAPPSRRLRIDFVVHGRFYAFHLARALIARGHDVRVLTNYPGWAAERFGIPASRVKSFVTHAIASRIHD